MTAISEQERRTVLALARDGHGLARQAVELWGRAAAQPWHSPARRHLRRAAERAATRVLRSRGGERR